ncbi:MAG: hypothetical protein ACR2MP_05700 [Streptosporangiaceae bacterium]
MQTVSYADGSSVASQYDANGNRSQMVNSSGTTTYTWDSLNRLTTVRFPGGKTIGYGYDPAGNRLTITYQYLSGSPTVHYSYDADNRPQGVQDWLGNTTTYSYTRTGQVYQVLFPASTGITSTYAYDNDGRVTSISHAKSGATLPWVNYGNYTAGGNLGQQ